MRFNSESKPCTGKSELFFSFCESEIEMAKSLCKSCDVRSKCLGIAIQNKERFGVWGGQLIHDGKIVDRRPRVGRPISDKKLKTVDVSVDTLHT